MRTLTEGPTTDDEPVFDDGGAAARAGGAALLRMLQLSSSLLPIGAFAYSQGLETAVDRGWVASESDLFGWLHGVGEHSLARLDLPVLLRCRSAWALADVDGVLQHSAELLSYRESRELREQERHLGAALARVLDTLGVAAAAGLVRHEDTSYVAAFALGSTHFALGDAQASYGYAFAWAEQLVSAAARLVPLGHLASQRVLSQVLDRIPDWIAQATHCRDDEIGTLTPGLCMASAWHESQYTRLFRS